MHTNNSLVMQTVFICGGAKLRKRWLKPLLVNDGDIHAVAKTHMPAGTDEKQNITN